MKKFTVPQYFLIGFIAFWNFNLSDLIHSLGPFVMIFYLFNKLPFMVQVTHGQRCRCALRNT